MSNYWTDERGFKWMSKDDHCGMYSDEAYPCMICKNPTHRLDINLHAYYCNTLKCNEKLGEELIKSIL